MIAVASRQSRCLANVGGGVAQERVQPRHADGALAEHLSGHAPRADVRPIELRNEPFDRAFIGNCAADRILCGLHGRRCRRQAADALSPTVPPEISQLVGNQVAHYRICPAKGIDQNRHAARVRARTATLPIVMVARCNGRWCQLHCSADRSCSQNTGDRYHSNRFHHHSLLSPSASAAARRTFASFEVRASRNASYAATSAMLPSASIALSLTSALVSSSIRRSVGTAATTERSPASSAAFCRTSESRSRIRAMSVASAIGAFSSCRELIAC